jgi:hypothetical protein
MVTWFIAHEHQKEIPHPPSSRTHALFDPLAAAGLIALLLAGYAFIMGPPATADALRVAAGAASGALALVFLIAAFGAAGRRLRRTPVARRARDRGEATT